jgi:hypothetical protein
MPTIEQMQRPAGPKISPCGAFGHIAVLRLLHQPPGQFPQTGANALCQVVGDLAHELVGEGKVQRTSRKAAVIFLCLALVVIVVAFISDQFPLGVATSGALMWLAILQWAYSGNKAWVPAIRLWHYRLLVWVPLLMMFGFNNAYLGAVHDLTKTAPVYRVDFKGKETASKPVILLRNFDKGILVHVFAERKVEFLRWDDLKSVSVVTPDVDPMTSMQIFLCK